AARSHNGPITRTVRDAAFMLNAIAGHDVRDAASIEPLVSDWPVAIENTDIRGLKVAWSPDFGYAPVDPEVRALTTAAAQRFTELGCSVEEVAAVPWEDPSEWASLLWDFQTFIRNQERAAQHPEWM